MKSAWSESLKEEVIKLRKEGLSYGVLSKKFKIAKSTLHYWLSEIEYKKEKTAQSRKNWIKNIQPLGALANHQKRLDKLKGIEKRTVKEVNKNNHITKAKKALLAMLYWAEGAKGRKDILSFANTDPQLAKLFICLLRESYFLDERKFRVRIHLHDYHDENEAKTFWSNLLGIPLSQFGKTYWKKGTNKIYRRNKAGICFVRYNSLALKEEVMFYARNVADSLTQETTK